MPIKLGILMPSCNVRKNELIRRIHETCRREDIDITDIDIALYDHENFPQLDILLHKITINSKTNEDEAIRIRNLVLKYALRNSKLKIIDNFENCEKILNRQIQTEVLKACSCTVDNITVFVPKTLSISEKMDIHTIKEIMKDNEIDFPILGKPLGDTLHQGCHDMVLVFSYEYLKDLPNPCLLQEFCNHNGILYKVFVIGDSYHVCERPSVKNLVLEKRKSVFFNSRQVSKIFPKLVYLPKLHENNPLLKHWLSSDLKPNMLNGKVVEEIIRRIKLKTGFYLFGFDILIESNTGDYAIIDLSQFPGYSGVDDELFCADFVKMIKEVSS